ncbi:hypothetical protein B0H19DRAFT_1264958 [Mycena capillaripes]|nr:hypothetical protein B0H19DRAFT_1264958 [Mycena capillaripes]
MASGLLAWGNNGSRMAPNDESAAHTHTAPSGHGRLRSQSAAGSILDVRFLPFNLLKPFQSPIQSTTPSRTERFRRTRSAYLGTSSMIAIPTSRGAVVPLRAVRADDGQADEKVAPLVPESSRHTTSPVFGIKAAKYGASVVSAEIESRAPGANHARRARRLPGYFYRVDEDAEELEDHVPEVIEALHVNASINAMGYRYEPLNAGQSVAQYLRLLGQSTNTNITENAGNYQFCDSELAQGALNAADLAYDGGENH